jgi:hypothetical protein
MDMSPAGDRDVQRLEHLAGQRIVCRGGEVGEEHRHLIAEDADRHEEEIVDAGEADGAAHARLPAQGLDEVIQVSGHRRRQGVGLPLIFFPVDDDREVRLTHVCHRHLTSMLRTVECCQMAACPGGRIADHGRRPPVLGPGRRDWYIRSRTAFVDGAY